MKNRRLMTGQLYVVVFLTWCSLTFSDSADAQNRDYETVFRVAGIKSDNIGRDSSSEIDEDIGRLGFSFDFFDQTNRFTAFVASNFDYLDYRDNKFEDQIIGGLTASIDLSLVEERVNWVLTENFGQTFSDSLLAPTPSNLENVNVVTTGPSVQWPIGARGLIGFDIRVSSVAFEVRNGDQERTLGAVRIGREIYRDAILSLNAQQREIEYESGSLVPDYEVQEGFLRLDKSTGRNIYGIDFGYSELERGGQTFSGPMFNLDWSRSVSALATLEIRMGSRYLDGADQFASIQTTGIDVGDLVDSSRSRIPFRFNFMSVVYGIDSSRTQAALQVAFRQEDFEEGVDSDRESTDLNLRLRRDISRSTFVDLQGRYQYRRFKDLGRRDIDGRYSIAFGYQWSGAHSLALEYAYSGRESDGVLNDFDENRISLIFSYRPDWAQSAPLL